MAGSFLKAIYAYGGRGYFDAFGHHPYSFPCSPFYGAPWNAFGQTAAIFYTMAVNGDGAKKVWGTESACRRALMSVCPAGAGVSVTEAVQALYVHEYLCGWTETFQAFTGPLILFSIRRPVRTRGCATTTSVCCGGISARSRPFRCSPP